nr:reverse transcriptase domain-containing protein [Tanacetum cinerariifolium]
MVEMQKDMLQMFCQNQQVNSVTPSCETCGGPHSDYECNSVGSYTQDVYATTGNYNSGGNTYQPQGDRNLLSYRSNKFFRPSSFNNKIKRPRDALPSKTEPNPRADIKAITIQSGIVLDGPLVPPSPPSSKEVKRESETITDQVLTENTIRVPPPVV